MKATSTIVAITASAAGVNAFVASRCNKTQHENQLSPSMSMSESATITSDMTSKGGEEKAIDQEMDFSCNDIGEELRQQQMELNLPIDYDTRENDILASLFGSDDIRNDFFTHTYGRRVAYFPRRKTSSKQHQLLETPISGFDLESLYNTNDWISLRKRGSRDMLNKEDTTYDELNKYIGDGGSAVIPVVSGDYLHSTKEEIDRALGVTAEYGTSMNIYHSGPSAVALNIHYDSYPVLVLHLEGEKEWIIQNDNFGQSVHDITDWKNVTLTAGDLLYIPKGVYHAATGDPERGSTHVTIGLN